MDESAGIAHSAGGDHVHERDNFLYPPLRSQNNLDASGAVGDYPRQLLRYPSGSGDADGYADDAEPSCGGGGAGPS